MTACASLPKANSTPIDTLVTDSPSPAAFESLAALTRSSPPARDMAALVTQFRGFDAPRVARSSPANYTVGDVVDFWSNRMNEAENEQVQAVLAYRSDALNMWFQLGEEVNQDTLMEAAAIIEHRILPTDRALFGNEWQPGVDGDDRINILHLKDVGGIGVAYSWSADEYVTAVNPFSNQRELLYVGLSEVAMGSDRYYAAIAHEMQHLIHWHADTNEEAWLGEGLSELAVHVNGYPTGRAASYVTQPDIQLNDLSQESDKISAHYGAATLFSIYFLDRFGEDAIRALIRQPANGIGGFNATLAALDPSLSFDDLFADWLVANFLEGLGRGEGVFRYRSLEVPAIRPQRIERFPAAVSATVSQYGADFIQISSQEPVTLVFTGTQQVPLVETEPHSGRYFWISSRADESDMSLTRPFDLSGLGSASLHFWTWYDVESGWDYAYVSVSADGGETWHLLETPSTTLDNPEGNSFGPGFTGISGGGREPAWIEENADLTPYVGQSILVRFQYITDDAVNHQGFVVDDVSIPELAFFDDVEGGDNGWQASGFVRTGHLLPQSYILQQILISDSEVAVQRLLLDEKQQGHWLIPLDKRYNELVLIISGSTPVTRSPAGYRLEITLSEEPSDLRS